MSSTFPSAGKVLVNESARNTGSGFILGIGQNLFSSTEEAFNPAGPCIYQSLVAAKSTVSAHCLT